jgi:hypothetical protein
MGSLKNALASPPGACKNRREFSIVMTRPSTSDSESTYLRSCAMTADPNPVRTQSQSQSGRLPELDFFRSGFPSSISRFHIRLETDPASPRRKYQTFQGAGRGILTSPSPWLARLRSGQVSRRRHSQNPMHARGALTHQRAMSSARTSPPLTVGPGSSSRFDHSRSLLVLPSFAALSLSQRNQTNHGKSLHLKRPKECVVR